MARTLTLPTPRRVGHLTGWDTLVAPGVLQQKDGSFLACLRFRGLDLHHALDTASVVQASRLNALLRRLGAGWGLMTEAHRHPCTSYPLQTFPEPVSRCLDQERQAWWQTPGHLYTTTTTLTLTYRRPPLALPGWKRFLFAHLPQQDLDAETLAWFTQEVARFLGLFRGCCATADWLQETDLLTYLKSTISLRQHIVAVPDLPIYLDTYLSDTDLTQERQWPSLLRWPQLGDQWLRCVSVKGYPQATAPGILDALADLPLAYRATCRYIPLAHGQAVQKLTRVRHAHYGLRKSVWSMALAHASAEDSPLEDHAALAFEEEAAEHQAGVRRGQFSYGYVTQTVVVWDDTFEGATAKAAQVADVINRADFVAKVETLNTLDAWVGTLPGQMVANVRQPLLHSHNLAHLLPLHAPWPGPSWNTHLGGPPLLQTVGSGQSPFALDTYDGDVGHFAVIGPTGAGKSTLGNMMAWASLHYPGAQVYIFEMGESFRCLTHALGGAWFDVGALVGETFTAHTRLDDADFHPWASGWHPPQGHLQCFELGGLMRTPSLVPGVVRAIADRIRSMQTGVPTMVLYDEAWKYITPLPGVDKDREAFSHRIEEDLRTARKLNTRVGFLTQSLADLAQSPMDAVVNESCQTKIFLANPMAHEPGLACLYERYGMNQRQRDIISTMLPKKEYYVKSPAGSRVFDLALGPIGLAYTGSGSKEDLAKIADICATSPADFPWLWLHEKGLHQEAERLKQDAAHAKEA